MPEEQHEALTDVLAGWLLGRLRDESGTSVTDLSLESLERPVSGQSSEMLIFGARWREGPKERSAELVLRRQPGPGGIFLRPDAIREARVLRGWRTILAPPCPPSAGPSPAPRCSEGPSS